MRVSRSVSTPFDPPAAIRLLLVEDDPSDAELVSEALSESLSPRFQVDRATRLATAHEILAAGATDVVLLDLELPDSHGIETFERLLDSHPDVPCIVLTGLDDDEMGLLAVRCGAQDFVVKDRPAPDVLVRSIRYAIERHSMLTRLEGAMREARASETRFRHLIGRSAEGILVVDAASVVRFANPAAESLLRRPAAELLGTTLALPVAAGRTLEVAVRRADGTSFPADVRVADLDWEGGAARLVSIHDLSDRKQAERVALARAVQRAFLPERMETRAGLLEVSGSNALCEDASGDFYDVVELDRGRIAVALGDVTGHGLGPALLMAQGRAAFRAFSRTLRDLPQILAHVNDALAADMTDGRFMTLFVAILDPHSGSVAWANAGHLPALVLRARSRTVERLPATGLVLGIARDVPYTAGRRLVLGPGDVLLMFSDGATEATDARGRRFGESRVAKVLRSTVHHDAETVLSSLRAAIEAWTGGRPIEDDLTLLAVRRVSLRHAADRVPPASPDPESPTPARPDLEIAVSADGVPVHPLPDSLPPTDGHTT